MMKFLFCLLLATACFGASPLSQLETAIKASKGVLSSAVIGKPLADLVSYTYGNATMQLMNPSFVLGTSTLSVNSACYAFGYFSRTELVFRYSSKSVLELSSQTTIGVPQPSIWKHFGKTPPADVNVSPNMVIVVSSEDTRLAIVANATFSAGSPYAEATSQFSSSVSSVRVVFNFDWPKLSAESVGSDISWSLPGSYKLFGGSIVATNVQFSASLSPLSIAVAADFAIGKHVTTTGTASWSRGSPLSFQTTLTTPWKRPLGIHWLTMAEGTASFTLGQGMTSLDMSGTGDLSWSTKSVNIAVGFSGTLFTDVFLDISGIPVMGFDQVYSNVSGGRTAPPVLTGIKAKDTATFSFAISDYAGQYAEGLTLKSTVVLERGAELYKVHHLIDQNSLPETTTFTTTLVIPIFSKTPYYVNFEMLVVKPFTATLGLQCTRLDFQVTVNTETSISLSGDFGWLPLRQKEPVTWTASGSFVTGADDLSLSSQLTSQWKDAFALKWLDIQSASISMSFAPSTVSLSLSGDVDMNFPDKQDTLSFSLSTNGGPGTTLDVSLSCTFSKAWNVTYLTSQIAPGSSIARVHDYTFTDHVSISFTLDTAEGITLGTTGDVLKGSLVDKVIHQFSPKNDTIQWTFGLQLPIFSPQGGDWGVQLTFKDQIELKPGMWFEDVSLNVGTGSFSLGTQFMIQPHNNPSGPLTFNVAGSVNPTGFSLFGDMVGTWDEPFGVHGFRLSNVAAQLGFGAPSGINKIGIGFDTQVGPVNVEFAGGMQAPDLLDAFFIGGFNMTKAGAVPELEISDVCLQWNAMVEKHPIDMKTVPDHWRVRPAPTYQMVFLEFAGASGTFGPYTYEAGFHIVAQLDLIGLQMDIDIGCGVNALSPDCGFEWNVKVNKTAFEDALKHIFELEDTPMSLISLNEATLTEWTAPNLSQKLNPKWHLDFEYHLFGKRHVIIDSRCPLTLLHGNFKQFYDEFIKSHL